MSIYGWVLFLGCIVPAIVCWFPPFSIQRTWKRFICSILPVVLIFGAWDVYAVMRGHWAFDPSAVWPVRIINLPIEEVLFFILIPMSCIVAWESIIFIARRK